MHKIIIFFWLALTPMITINAQIAEFLFNDNLNDELGNFHGSASGMVSFDSGEFVTIQGDGIVTFPKELGNTLALEESFGIQFDFRIYELNEYPLLLSASEFTDAPPWQEKGFRIQLENTGLLLNYGNGGNSDHYFWETTFNANPDDWNQLAFAVDFERKVFSVKLNGNGKLIPFESWLDEESLRGAIVNNFITLGGFNGMNRGNYQAKFDMDNLQFYAPKPDNSDKVISFYNELKEHLQGSISLSDDYILTNLKEVEADLNFISYSLEIHEALLSFCLEYEAQFPPLYEDGVNHSLESLPVLGRALQDAQQFIFQQALEPDFIDLMEGVKFEHREVIPGKVLQDFKYTEMATAHINGSYNSDPAAVLTDQSRVVRPTGFFLKAGDIVTVEVPEQVVNSGLSIIVGHHFRNMEYDYIGSFNRMPDISAEFPMDAKEIKIVNPFGGLIYVKVPDGSNMGSFEITIMNAVEAPFFSWTADRKTNVSEWLSKISSASSPWIDFESDNYMFTIPLEDAQSIQNPDAIMDHWDQIIDAVDYVGGRIWERPRAEYYTLDTRLVTPAYGAGYPIVIPLIDMRRDPEWNPIKVTETMPHPTLFHEMGHNQLHPTLDFGQGYNSCGDIEAETIVHTLASIVYSQVYGLSTKEAYAKSNVMGMDYTIEMAVIDWIMSSNFRKGAPMGFDEEAPLEDKDQLKYQPRGWAKYIDIARLFGWEGLYKVNAEFFDVGEIQYGEACPDRPFIKSRDEYIQAACAAIGEDVTPLFHFWGIVPSPEIREEMGNLYPTSCKVKELLKTYRNDVAPKSKSDFEIYYHLLDKPGNGYQKPRYDLYLEEFDQSYVDAIQNQFELLFETYQFNGPEPVTDLFINEFSTSAILSWTYSYNPAGGFLILGQLENEEIIDTLAFLNPDERSFDLTNLPHGTYILSVIALDGNGLGNLNCGINTITFESIQTAAEDYQHAGNINIYPNPVSDFLTIKNESQDYFKKYAILDSTGKILRNGEIINNLINVQSLNAGFYLLRLENDQNETRLFKFIISQ